MSLKPFEVQVLRGNIKLLQSRAFFPGPNVVAALLLGCLATCLYSYLPSNLLIVHKLCHEQHRQQFKKDNIESWQRVMPAHLYAFISFLYFQFCTECAATN
jgi:hypothetical protein